MRKSRKRNRRKTPDMKAIQKVLLNSKLIENFYSHFETLQTPKQIVTTYEKPFIEQRTITIYERFIKSSFEMITVQII